MRLRIELLALLSGLLLLAQTNQSALDQVAGLVISLFAILIPGIVLMLLVKAFVKLVKL
jgi:hypothetical protein